VFLPASILYIGDDAFAECTQLKSITVQGTNPIYTSVGGVLYNKAKTSLLLVPPASELAAIVIGKDVESIKAYAFTGAKVSVSFDAGGKIKTLESYTFAKFNGIVTLGKQIEEIRKRAFFLMTGEVIFSDTEIDTLTNGAFDSFLGERLVVPKSVKNISLHAFYQSTAEITFEEGSELKTVGSNAFNNFMGKVTFRSGIVAVEDYAFCFAVSSAVITFSDAEESIAMNKELAFYRSKAEVVFLGN